MRWQHGAKSTRQKLTKKKLMRYAVRQPTYAAWQLAPCFMIVMARCLLLISSIAMMR